MTSDQGEEKDPKTKENQSINRGVELMLRRETKEPDPKGLKLFQHVTLLKRQFSFRVELTWRRVEDT
jgi:hypothetical protein